jgi:hypothetical protein
MLAERKSFVDAIKYRKSRVSRRLVHKIEMMKKAKSRTGGKLIYERKSCVINVVILCVILNTGSISGSVVSSRIKAVFLTKAAEKKDIALPEE